MFHSLSGKWPNVFDLMRKRRALYMANYKKIDDDYGLPGTTIMRNLTMDFINKKNLTIRNPSIFADIFNERMEVPNFWNNFEIVDLSLMQRKDVLDFINMIDESKGIFLYRWGDAPLRYLTAALFINAGEILHRTRLGFHYCHPC